MRWMRSGRNRGSTDAGDVADRRAHPRDERGENLCRRLRHVIPDAVLRYINGELESAQSCESDGERITRIHVQRNPEKLVRLVAAIAQRRRPPA